MIALTQEVASQYARIALGHVTREYPNKLDHVLANDADARTPRQLHPVFFGSYDWHSCVHSWWLLLRLRRLYPAMEEAGLIGQLAQRTFTQKNIAGELAYARRPQSTGFERPYGWAWLLRLHEEAPETLPLATHFAAGFREYLAKLQYPITTGTHYNTAFALTLALRWARRCDRSLQQDIEAWATRHFGNLDEYRGWEPNGDEFLSPVLSVALLMSQILPQAEFAHWLSRVLPEGGWLESACRPVTVSDPSDGKMAHLDGLNLSRAWALRSIAPLLADRSRRTFLLDLADRHFAASIGAVDGDYMGSHWLASFALLAQLPD